MRGGFRTAIHLPTRISEVDLEATRAEREELHRRLRLHAHLIEVFTSIPPGDDRLVIEAEPLAGKP